MYKFSLFLIIIFIFFSCGKNPEEQKKEVKRLFSEAINLYDQGQIPDAESLLIDALRIEQGIQRHDYLGHIQLYLGLTSFQQSKYYTSLDYYKNALKEYEITQDLKNQAVVLTNIGGIYAYLNQYENALDSYNKSYSISRFSLDKESQAIALSSIGLAYDALEEYDKSFEYLNKSIIMDKISDDNVSVAKNLNNIGELFLHQGKYNDAQKYFNESLSLAAKLRDVDLEGICLKNLGNVLKNSNKNEDALNIYFSSLMKARLAPNPDVEREILNNIGEIYFKTYQYDKARIAFEEALNIARGKDDKFSEGFFLTLIGSTLKALALAEDEKKLDNAEIYFNDALTIFKEIKYSIGISSSYFNLAKIFEIRKYSDKAIEYYKNAIRIRENIIDPPKNSFLFQLIQTEELSYSPLVDLLLQKGKNEEAFLYLERQKNWKISELLKSSKIKFNDSKDEAFNKRVNYLRNEISSLYYSFIFESSKPQRKDERIRTAALEESIINKKEEYSKLRTEILKTNSIIRYFVDLPKASFKDIQNKIPENTLIIEHFPVDTSLYIFSVTNNSFDIQKRSLSAEVLASQKSLFLNLIYSGNDPRKKQENPNINLFQDLKITLFSHLISPIENKLNNIKTISFIFPDNESFFPYSFLLTDNDKFKNLEITYLPSFSCLEWSRGSSDIVKDINILADRFKYADIGKILSGASLDLKFIANAKSIYNPNNKYENSVLFIMGDLSEPNRKLNNVFIKITPYDSLSYDYILGIPKSKIVVFSTNDLKRPEIPLMTELFLLNGLENVICYYPDNETNSIISEFLINIKNKSPVQNLRERIKKSTTGTGTRIFIFGK